MSAIEYNPIEFSYKMNDIISKFLVAGGKFVPEMHLRPPKFTYSACGPFTKNKERSRKFKETGDIVKITENIFESSLVKKPDYNTKISEIEIKVNDHNHDKYITNPELNTLTARVFNASLAQANLITKTDFDARLKKN